MLDLIEPNFAEDELKHKERQQEFESHCSLFETEFDQRDAVIDQAA